MRHRVVDVDGLKMFYREAGADTSPALLLLHGFPTSSHMFRDLIPALADDYRVVAPDLPGFRLATRHPERITAVISQNGNAYEEGLSEGWNPIQRYWKEPTPKNREAL